MEATENPGTAPAPEAPPQVEDEFISALQCKRSELAACGIAPDADWKMNDKIPHLSLTWEQAAGLEIEIPAGVQKLQQLKTGPYEGMPLYFLIIGDTRFVMRGTTRLEWNAFTIEAMGDVPKKRQELAEKGMDPGQIDIKMKSVIEEKVVEKFTILPKLTHDDVIRLQPGDVTQLYEAWMLAVGFQEPPPAIKL